MQREYPDRPLVGVGAIIVHGGRVVLIKRGKEPLLGEWSIPGGMLEIGETLRRGAEREGLEETGLVVRATEVLGVFDRIIPDHLIPDRTPPGAGRRTLYHYVLIDFLCEIVSGELHPSGDAADARWFTSEELGALSLAEDAAAVIRLAVEKSKNQKL